MLKNICEEIKTSTYFKVKVNVDTDEAQEKIKSLTQAIEKCGKAFEDLGKITSVWAIIKGNQVETAQIEIPA